MKGKKMKAKKVKKLSGIQAKAVCGGKNNLEIEIPPKFKRLIEAIESFASVPTELSAVLENRVKPRVPNGSAYSKRPRLIDA